MDSQYERAYSVNESLSIAEMTINALNLTDELTCNGKNYQTYRCKLIDDKNKLIFYGFGKGIGLQSKASAYYEALEHYALYQFAQNLAADDRNYHAIEPYEHPLPCANLNDTQNNTMLYPVFLLDPRYAKRQSNLDKMDYTKYSWRANDSGVASGTNIIEASIHALNELVERDAHSLFLIEAFLKRKDRQLKLIDKGTLPKQLQSMLSVIEAEYNDDLYLFDITTDIGIPTYYASMTRQPFIIQPSGCGTSLHPEYAISRAILESLQPLHIYNSTLQHNQQALVEKLSPYPLLLQAAIADVTTLSEACDLVPFNTHSHSTSLTLTQQLDTIQKNIANLGYDIYNLPINVHKTGFTCVKYHIPALEQFHLVQTGKCMLPSKRGLRLLNANEKTQCFN